MMDRHADTSILLQRQRAGYDGQACRYFNTASETEGRVRWTDIQLGSFRRWTASETEGKVRWIGSVQVWQHVASVWCFGCGRA